MSFSNDCWFKTILKIKEICKLDVDILNLFNLSMDIYNSSLESIGFDKTVSLGDQMPIEIIETILEFIDIRIQLRSYGTNESRRWIGADYTMSTIVVTDFYIHHSGNIDTDMGSETGHYCLKARYSEINAIQNEYEKIKHIESDRIYAQSISC